MVTLYKICHPSKDPFFLDNFMRFMEFILRYSVLACLCTGIFDVFVQMIKTSRLSPYEPMNSQMTK